jgi:hypothetical protein
MTKTDRTLFIPLIGLFIAVSCIFQLLKSWLTGNGVDHALILSGNFLIFLDTAVALLFHIQGFHHKNPNVFLRSVYASLLVKMFVFAGAAFVCTHTRIHKRAQTYTPTLLCTYRTVISLRN